MPVGNRSRKQRGRRHPKRRDNYFRQVLRRLRHNKDGAEALDAAYYRSILKEIEKKAHALERGILGAMPHSSSYELARDIHDLSSGSLKRGGPGSDIWAIIYHLRKVVDEKKATVAAQLILEMEDED